MEDRSHSDHAVDVGKEHEVQEENSYLKFDWFDRHFQLRHPVPGTMKNPDSFTLNSPETSPKFFRRSFDFHMLRPETHIYDTTYRSLSDSELDKPNDSSMTAEFMDLPRKLPKRLSLHTKRSYNVKDRPESLQNRRAVNSTSGLNLPTSVPKIEFSNVHVVVEDIDDERLDMSGFFIGDSNYTCVDYNPGNSGMWMGLEPQSHALLSPRSSNGSICSYRSSNADSAIEILTPDEEIPDHSPTESSDSRFWENRHSSIKTSSHTTLESVHSPGARSSIHFIPESNQAPHSHNSGDDTIPSHFSTSYIDPHASSSSVPSHLETIYRSEITISPSDVHNRSFTKSSPTSSNIISYKSSIQKPSSVLNSSTQSSSSTFHPKKLVPFPQQTTHFQGRSISPHSTSYKQGSSLQTSATVAQVPSRSIPPSVVISDFSSRYKLKDKGSQTVDSESGAGPLTSYLTEGTSYVRRSLSNCSISSNESSTFSVPSDSSLDVEEAPVYRRPKTSSWKKIRNIVHWSPFIQQFKRRKYPWIQLAGHQGNFQAGDPGAILKKYDKREYTAFKKLMKDVLRPYVPEYRGESSKDGDRYVQLQDLLCEFEAPCVMDMKMGCRTYLEEELVKARENPSLRKDMYQKMVEVDPMAPTEEEHNQKAITKPRYMQWRDDMSSTSEMGFRIEGIRKSDGAQVKNFKKTKDKNSVKECLKLFVEENPLVVSTYLRRLKAIRATQETSPFFKSHETIGSSLLFVHDRGGLASIWMIDFGKTIPLPENVSTTHRNQWIEGNHEDGYLYGMDRLIEIFDELNTEYCNSETNTSDYQCKITDTETSIDTHPQHQKDTSELISVHNTETAQSSTLTDDGTPST